MDTQSITAFLSAAVQVPKLRAKLMKAIEADDALSGAYELHTAQEERNAEGMADQVSDFVAAIQSGDGSKQEAALDGMDVRLFKELNRQGFTADWITEQLQAAD